MHGLTSLMTTGRINQVAALYLFPKEQPGEKAEGSRKGWRGEDGRWMAYVKEGRRQGKGWVYMCSAAQNTLPVRFCHHHMHWCA